MTLRCYTWILQVLTHRKLNINIHLIQTCLVTNKRLNTNSSNVTENVNGRSDSFLFSLLQNSRLPLSSSSFNLAFDETTSLHESLSNKLIHELYSKVSIKNKRLEFFDDWKLLLEDKQLKSCDLILLNTYDDHAFIDDNTDEFLQVAERVLKLNNDGKQVYGSLTHFPEIIGSLPLYSGTRFLQTYREYCLIPARKPLGAVLLTYATLQNWFKSDIWGKDRIVAPENYFGPSIITPYATGVVPKKEILRHLDGYSHVGILEMPFEKYIPPELTHFLSSQSLEKEFITNVTLNSLRDFHQKQSRFANASIENRILKINARRLNLPAVKYVLGKNYTYTQITLLMISVFGILQLTNMMLYKCIETVYKYSHVKIYLIKYKLSGKFIESQFMDFIELVISFRLLRAIGIRTSIRGHLSRFIRQLMENIFRF